MLSGQMAGLTTVQYSGEPGVMQRIFLSVVKLHGINLLLLFK
ncbi:hypothetical protein NXU96_22410 [Phocaeicola vulgatus]|nr:hypothetical protein [Phocaeicola vulgatus]